ncbi:MAG: hypothetical protein R3A48_23870 [Polyangiales bacterium]
MANAKTTKAPAALPSPPPATVEVGEETLLATRARALALLAGIGSHEGIRLALSARGYTETDHAAGWEALHAASGYRVGAPFGSSSPDEVATAQRELDAWDDVNFPIAAAALKHRHPEAHAAVFAGELRAGAGAESVVRVSLFLDRLDALQKVDAPALRTLAARGISPDERARLRALVKSATTFRAVDTGERDAAQTQKQRTLADRDAALRVLRAWYEEWSVVARQVIRRKDWLISLGLASRKSPKRPPTPDAAAPTPV